MPMRLIYVVLALIAGVAAAPEALAQASDVLGPARQGQVQCFEPVVDRKVCGVLSRYAFSPGGTISNDADMLVLSDPLVVMRMSSPVVVRDGAVCGPLREEDLSRATFTVNGEAASTEDAESIRRAIGRQMAPMMNVEVCTTFTPDGDALRADSTANGEPRPEMSERVLWVNPAEGWRIGE
jgi:hypothetical protein